MPIQKSSYLVMFTIFAGFLFQTEASAECWKKVSINSATEEWRTEDKENFLRVTGDFNGDGNQDYADIEKSCDAKRLALFSFVGHPGGKHKKVFLSDIPVDQELVYGIRLAKPGEYVGACSKGYFECTAGQEKVNLQNNSIELFKYEGVSSIFFWDSKVQKFHRLWTSD